MTGIELADDQAAALAAKAAALGLTLEDWFKSLAGDSSGEPGGVQWAADIVLEEMRNVPGIQELCVRREWNFQEYPSRLAYRLPKTVHKLGNHQSKCLLLRLSPRIGA